jgi:hypothetical protein
MASTVEQVYVVLAMEEEMVLMGAEHQIDLLNWEVQPIVVEDPWVD